jgi:hypothetical protein
MSGLATARGYGTPYALQFSANASARFRFDVWPRRAPQRCVAFRIRLDFPADDLITREISSNSDVAKRNVTQIRLLIGRSNSIANFPGVNSIRRRRKCPRYLSSCVST